MRKPYQHPTPPACKRKTLRAVCVCVSVYACVCLSMQVCAWVCQPPSNGAGIHKHSLFAVVKRHSSSVMTAEPYVHGVATAFFPTYSCIHFFDAYLKNIYHIHIRCILLLSDYLSRLQTLFFFEWLSFLCHNVSLTASVRFVRAARHFQLNVLRTYIYTPLCKTIH